LVWVALVLVCPRGGGGGPLGACLKRPPSTGRGALFPPRGILRGALQWGPEVGKVCHSFASGGPAFFRSAGRDFFRPPRGGGFGGGHGWAPKISPGAPQKARRSPRPTLGGPKVLFGFRAMGSEWGKGRGPQPRFPGGALVLGGEPPGPFFSRPKRWGGAFPGRPAGPGTPRGGA